MVEDGESGGGHVIGDVAELPLTAFPCRAVVGVVFMRVNAAAAAQSAGAFTVIAEDGTPDEAVETLIRQRADAKKAKNFAEADRIRDELKAMGVELTDVAGGAKWKRI